MIPKKVARENESLSSKRFCLTHSGKHKGYCNVNPHICKYKYPEEDVKEFIHDLIGIFNNRKKFHAKKHVREKIQEYIKKRAGDTLSGTGELANHSPQRVESEDTLRGCDLCNRIANESKIKEKEKVINGCESCPLRPACSLRPTRSGDENE